MSDERATYRLVPIGQSSPDDVTVGIEQTADGALKASLWWEAKRDVDAGEEEYADVIEALGRAEAARALYGFNAIVVVLSDPQLWDQHWGDLQTTGIEREPLGDLQSVPLSSEEAFELATEIEQERDA